MNALERCRKVLQGELADRVPVVPQSFMFAVDAAGFSINEVNRSGRKMAEAHRFCQEKYGYDGIVVDFDDASLAEACGANVIFRDDAPAIVDESRPLLRDLREVENLRIPDPYKDGRLPEWLEATKMLSETVGREVFIMGRADQGPFSLACLLRGTEQFMMDLLIEDQEVVARVIDFCRTACERFAKAQKDCGAHATSIGDALAGPNLISPDMYRSFALQPAKILTKDVKNYGIPFSIHICGDTTEILADMASTGADIFELDWKVDMGLARKVLPDKAVIMGNIDPSDPLVHGSPAKVEKVAETIIRETRGRGLFLSSGCAMGRNTPVENFEAMINAAEKFGTFELLADL